MTAHYIMESSALPATEMTFGRSKSIVARAVGNAADPETLSRATDALQYAIAEWNRRLALEWNALTHTTINVTSGTDTYELPSDFLHIYSVRMTTQNDRPLHFLQHRLYDKQHWDQDTGSMATHYTLFGHAQTGYIKLIPIPSESDTMSIKYYKAIAKPSSDDDKYAMPERYVWGIIAKAKAVLLADIDSENPRIGMWLREAEQCLQEARFDDSHRPDEIERLIPAMEHGSKGWPGTHPYYWLDGEGNH